MKKRRRRRSRQRVLHIRPSEGIFFQLWSLRDYFHSTDPTAQRYNRYHIKQTQPELRLSGYLVGSVLSQRSSGVNRDNSWLPYPISDVPGDLLYGEVQTLGPEVCRENLKYD